MLSINNVKYLLFDSNKEGLEPSLLYKNIYKVNQLVSICYLKQRIFSSIPTVSTYSTTF